jgi:hypothetical protein
MSPDNRSLGNVTPEQLARLLSQTGLGRVSAENVTQAIEAGVPQNEDGTLHLVHFGAWLAQQLMDGT